MPQLSKVPLHAAFDGERHPGHGEWGNVAARSRVSGAEGVGVCDGPLCEGPRRAADDFLDR